MQSPSSPTLESTTCVSNEPQKGHFISLPVNRKFRRQRFHLALNALNHALVVRRIQEISDQIGELLCFQLLEAARRHGWGADSNAASDKRFFGIIRNGVLVDRYMSVPESRFGVFSSNFLCA